MSKEELKRSLGKYRRYTGLLCFVGFLLATYATYVEISKDKDPSYTAMCDISEHISCSKVFTSEYGTGFGLVGKILGPDSIFNKPNGLVGMIMYPVFFITSVFANSFFAFLELMLGISSVIISLYLGYTLFYILEDACLICITTYVVNFFLFICAVLNYRTVKQLAIENSTPEYFTTSDVKSKKRV